MSHLAHLMCRFPRTVPPNFHALTSYMFSQSLFQYFFALWHYGPTRAMAFSFTRFLDHTQRSTTVGRTPLDEWSARRKDLYLTTHNTHNRQTDIHAPPVGFETTISAGERPQTYPLDRADIGTGEIQRNVGKFNFKVKSSDLGKQIKYQSLS